MAILAALEALSSGFSATKSATAGRFFLEMRMCFMCIRVVLRVVLRVYFDVMAKSSMNKIHNYYVALIELPLSAARTMAIASGRANCRAGRSSVKSSCSSSFSFT
jgi:hypothetical protein